MKAWFDNLKIGTRITSGFLLIVVVTAIIGGIGAVNLYKIDQNYMELVQYNPRISSELVYAYHNTAVRSIVIIIIGVVLGIVLAIIIGLYIAKDISNGAKKLLKAANTLALGDVDVQMKMMRQDELGLVFQAFDKMIESIREQALAVEKIAQGDLTAEVPIRSEKDLLGQKLNEMIEKVNEVLLSITSASEQVAAGAEQMSESSVNLSQGAAEQASSIEELTTSIEEISSQTKLNAENANRANKLAERAKINASQGSSQMEEMLKAMEEINESSTNISKIIKVIDDIAFQTNILALNAAVEAARAGQHGKGFAVVAEEVRNLAARSADAAKETTEMIGDSIKKAEEGTKIAEETAVALNRIVNGVEKVSSILNEIATASNDQAEGIEQINQGIMQVSKVVENNSATSEESAAASEELSNQANLLNEMVSKFTLRVKEKSKSKSNKQLNKEEDINPEVLKMLESMAEEKAGESAYIEGKEEVAASKEEEVSISDKEFGKY